MLKKYLCNTSGNFSIMLSITLLALGLGVGAAIDTSGLVSQRATLQSMSDNATLAAVASGEEDLDALKAIVEKTLEENNFNDLDYTWDIVPTENGITVQVHSTYNTRLLAIAGQDSWDVSALSSAPIGGAGALNLALVLDSTFSMQGENMTNLQSAATNLVTTIEEAGDDVHMSVVPFATYVKIDTQYETANWTDVPADYTSTRLERQVVNAGLCIDEEYERVRDGITVTETREVCADGAYGPETEVIRTHSWDGCMGSRSSLHRTYPEHGSRAIPGLNHYRCGTTLLPLTNDYNAVRARINAMNARDDTYIPAGLIWGWRTLDEQLPFNEASLLGDGRERAMILMTDGHNVKSKGTKFGSEAARPEADAFHEGSDGEKGDQYTAELCRNIKNDNIRVFVIAYRLAGADTVNTQNTLRSCATTSTDFYNAQNGAELDTAFQNIGKSFSTVHLSQ